MLGCLACDRRYSVGLNGLGDVFDDLVASMGVEPTDTYGGVYDPGWNDPIGTSTTVGAPSVASSINWNSILGQWTAAGTAIAKAGAGANPTYQQITPNGSITVYGNPANASLLPSLPSTIGGLNLSTLLLLGSGALVLMMVVGKH